MKQNGSVRGEKAQEYVDISRLLDEAMGHFDQIPSGRPNGFHLDPKAACKGNQPSRRVFRPDLFAIWAPRRRRNGVRTLILRWLMDGGFGKLRISRSAVTTRPDTEWTTVPGKYVRNRLAA
ncbi:MAG: hypothetical protein ACT6QT_01335 [Sphingopyxis sp.]|uniref:hypothetical protein n=1 Tax=Sphingopyxis sp. TaxID=1908224 RepID=UPI003F6F3EDB